MASLILCAFVDIVHTKMSATIDSIVPIEIHAVVVELRKSLIDDMERSMMSVPGRLTKVDGNLFFSVIFFC